MNPRTLAVLIVLYATAGALLAIATPGALRGWVAFLTGTVFVFALGASWPAHRLFPIGGMVLGALFAATSGIVLASRALTENSPPGFPIIWYAIWGLQASSAFFGAWTVVLLTGAGTTWVARRVFARPAYA
ncbi:MAG: hypothetical protein WEB04_02515 [Dehalococcoidia bacterium]